MVGTLRACKRFVGHVIFGSQKMTFPGLILSAIYGKDAYKNLCFSGSYAYF